MDIQSTYYALHDNQILPESYSEKTKNFSADRNRNTMNIWSPVMENKTM